MSQMWKTRSLYERDRQNQKQESHEVRYRKKDLVRDKFRMKVHANQMVKKAFAVWSDYSSESGEEIEETEDVLMLSIEDDERILNKCSH